MGRGFWVWAQAAGVLGLFKNFSIFDPKICDFWGFWGNCTGRGRTFGQKSAIFDWPSSSGRFEQNQRILKIHRFLAQIDHCSGGSIFEFKNSKNHEKIFLRKIFGLKIAKNDDFRKLPRPVGSLRLEFGPKKGLKQALFGQPGDPAE